MSTTPILHDPDIITLTKHLTPGPWTLCAHLAQTDLDCRCGYMGNVWGADEETIVAFMGHCQPHSDSEFAVCGGDALADEPTRIANARLIAAAPDLLAALRQIADLQDDPATMRVIARRAIAAVTTRG